MLALSMTANGAKGETLAQMEALLGGDIPIGELNEYYPDLWRRGITSFGGKALNQEMQTLSNFILKAA